MALAGTQLVDCAANYNLYAETQKDSTCHVCLSTGAVLGLAVR